jgi:predicted lactoylglutathione lyase
MDQVFINIPTSSIARPSKIYPNLGFWFENKQSGNPDLDIDRHCTHFLDVMMAMLFNACWVKFVHAGNSFYALKMTLIRVAGDKK